MNFAKRHTIVLLAVLAIFAGVTAYLAVHSYNGNGPDSFLVSVACGILVASAVCFPRRTGITVGDVFQQLGRAVEYGGWRIKYALHASGHRVGCVIDHGRGSHVLVEVEGYDDELDHDAVVEQVDATAQSLRSWHDVEMHKLASAEEAERANTLPVASAS